MNGVCPVCEGTGVVSNCSPLTCDGSHVNCVNDDCPACQDPSLPDEPPDEPPDDDPESAAPAGVSAPGEGLDRPSEPPEGTL